MIATVAPAPPVYDPGGLTCTVDDFTVADPRDWPTLGVDLLRAVGRAALERGAAQIVVVTARLDEAKRAVLAGSGLSVASEWWVRPLNANEARRARGSRGTHPPRCTPTLASTGVILHGGEW